MQLQRKYSANSANWRIYIKPARVNCWEVLAIVLTTSCRSNSAFLNRFASNAENVGCGKILHKSFLKFVVEHTYNQIHSKNGAISVNALRGLEYDSFLFELQSNVLSQQNITTPAADKLKEPVHIRHLLILWRGTQSKINHLIEPQFHSMFDTSQQFLHFHG
jgi:hypothetical protein